MRTALVYLFTACAVVVHASAFASMERNVVLASKAATRNDKGMWHQMDVLSVEAYSYCLAMTKRVCKATHTDAMELKICDVEVNDLCVRSELSRPKSGVFDSRSSNPP